MYQKFWEIQLLMNTSKNYYKMKMIRFNKSYQIYIKLL